MEQVYQNSNSMSKEEYVEYRKQQREEAFAVVDATAQEVMQDDTALKEYLAHLAACKPSNTPNLLYLYAQNPEYKEVRTFDAWKKRGCGLQKGAKGIPMLVGHQYEKDGETRTGYNVETGFDKMQTQAPLRKQGRVHLPEQSFTVEKALEIVISNSNVNIQVVEMDESIDAVYLPEDKTLFLRDGMQPEEAFAGLSRELAHAHFDWWDMEYTREQYADAALAASCIAMNRVGIDTSAHDFSGICEAFQDKDPAALRAFISDAQHGAYKATICLDKHVEKGRDTQAREAQTQAR